MRPDDPLVNSPPKLLRIVRIVYAVSTTVTKISLGKRSSGYWTIHRQGLVQISRIRTLYLPYCCPEQLEALALKVIKIVNFKIHHPIA